MGKKITTGPIGKTAVPAAIPTAIPAQPAAAAHPAIAAKVSAPRNSPVPKNEPMISPKKEITHDTIARRAYEISVGGTGGDAMHNWLRAERELRGL